ncbi:MAG: adenylate/guanylate cyclase domain-containing protein [Desertifilum sp. SIO1I2]|nr:adenylate/guanylate cyclase domain-containing protein [Desertifilum sp. SIO1I2]
MKGTQAVEQGNLEVQVAITSTDEIGILSESFNLMLDKVRQKERIKATFGQYVDPRIVEELIHQKTSNNTTNKQIVTVFFSDIAGFSTISEMLTPGGLVKLINQYLTLASEPIAQNNGVINQFLGDAVSAFWGYPFVNENDHAKLACYAALEQSNQLNKLRRMMPETMGLRKGLPEIKVRIGLATGKVVTGNIGSEHSKFYTVMGKAVQIAEQLEGMNKIYGTTILLMEETKMLAAEAIETREIDRLYLGDRNEPIGVYELLSYAGELEPKLAEWRDRFEVGLREYRQQNWEQAQSNFQACLHLKADDKPTQLYLKRIEFLRQNPPAQDWNGVWENFG